MVVHTMSDEEKTFEALRVTPIAMKAYVDMGEEISRKFLKGTKFPYFQRIMFKDDRHNEWYLTFMCLSKSDKKKHRFYCFCYTIYEIEKKKSDGMKKIDGNTGKGILSFDPIAANKALEKKEHGLVAVVDIVPHAFNRYTERYLKPLGKENIEFVRKVESIMARSMHFDVMGDESSEKNKDKGFAPYDIFMKGGGILRGYFASDMLIRFFSYISDDMLHESQREWQEEMTKEHFRWKNLGMYERLLT